MADFSSNKAAWLIAGFLGRKFMRDMLGRWSFIPVLAIGLCLWTRWITHQEGKMEQGKLEELRRKTNQRLHALRKKAAASLLPSSSSPSWSASSALKPRNSPAAAATPVVSEMQHVQQRRPGDRLGGIPSAMNTVKRDNKNKIVKHLSPSAAIGIDPSAPKDALASELWAWLGGVGVGRVCGYDRSIRSHAAAGARGAGGRDAGSGGDEWRGAFTNRMGNLPRRSAFKTARGKVYLRSGSRRSGWARPGQPQPSVGVLESVREEDETGLAP